MYMGFVYLCAPIYNNSIAVIAYSISIFLLLYCSFGPVQMNLLLAVLLLFSLFAHINDISFEQLNYSIHAADECEMKIGFLSL